MNVIGKKEKAGIIIASIVYVICIVLIIYGVFSMGLGKISSMYIVNISIDIFAMLTGFVLFLCCLIDVQKGGSDMKYIMYLINVCFLHVFADASTWLVEGTPGLEIFNMLDNTLFYMCESATVCLFWMYITSLIKFTDPIEKKLDMAVQYGLIISVVVRALNMVGGFYFTIEPGNIYKRGAFFPVSKLYVALVMIAIAYVVIKERKQLALYQIIASFIFLGVPILAALFTVMVYGLSVTAALTMILLLLMYCVHNVAQGREKAAADHDLSVAAAIQENILPRTFPYMPERKEFDIYATMTPAKEVGGDFYDFFMTDDDHLAFVVADVSGKGMPAALFMMVARTILKNQATGTSHFRDPGWILKIVNNQLCEGNTMEYFVTAWLGILELSTGHLAFASAGHEYPAICRCGGDFELFRDRNSPPLGSMEDLTFHTNEMELEPGDIVFIYTDGVTEATNSSRQLFGSERMLESLNGCDRSSLEGIDSNLRKSIDDFVKDAPQFDDITMLGLRFNGTTESLSE